MGIIRLAKHTCAGCNFSIIQSDPRWINEGQHISCETLFFHDNRCLEQMLNREYATYRGQERLNPRQEFKRVRVEKEAAR
jgi:hypothetical protein